MEYKTLGNTELNISSICLGTMTFGDGADEATSRVIYAKCRNRGINFFDCANVYAKGESERILGRLIKRHRSEVIVATKAYYPMGNEVNSRGLSRSQLTAALAASLERLNTDYIDLYYLHAFDEDTPLKETLETLNDFVRQGKIRYIGVSNFAAWQVMKALSIAEQQHYESIACIQPMYNLLKRQCESEILPMAASEKLGVLSYSPIAGGYLSGKYLDAKSVDGRLATSETYKKRYADESNRKTTEQFISFAQKQNIHPASLAIAWVASHPVVTAPIIGARNIDQLRTALDSLDIEMSGDMRRKISGFSREPALPTDRTEEQP